MVTLKDSIFPVLALLVIQQSCTVTASQDSDIINPNWKRPGIWHQRTSHLTPAEQSEQCAPSEVPPNPEHHEQEFNLLKKFVRRFFDDKRLQKEPESDYLVRTVQLKITQHQLDMLKQAKTTQELHGIVSSVVEQSEDGYIATASENFSWNIMQLARWVGSNGYFLYVFVPTLGLLGVNWLVRVNARIMGIHPLVALISMALLMTYVITYRDCNRKLEADALARLKFSDGTNPCEQNTGFFGWFKDTFYGVNEAKCRKFILENIKEGDIKTCDPWKVFVEMIANVKMHYFGTLLENLIAIFHSTYAYFGFFGSKLYAMVFITMISVLLTTTVWFTIIGLFNLLRVCINGRPRGAPPSNALHPDQPQQQLPINANIKVNQPAGSTSSRIKEIAEPRPAHVLPEKKTPRIKEPTVDKAAENNVAIENEE